MRNNISRSYSRIRLPIINADTVCKGSRTRRSEITCVRYKHHRLSTWRYLRLRRGSFRRVQDALYDLPCVPDHSHVFQHGTENTRKRSRLRNVRTYAPSHIFPRLAMDLSLRRYLRGSYLVVGQTFAPHSRRAFLWSVILFFRIYPLHLDNALTLNE